MKELDDNADYLIRECLNAKTWDGVYSAAKELFRLADTETRNSSGERDSLLVAAESYGFAQTNERVIYYYVADRTLFFQRLVELYGQEAITNWLLQNET